MDYNIILNFPKINSINEKLISNKPYKGLELLYKFMPIVNELAEEKNGKFNYNDCINLIKTFKSYLYEYITSIYIYDIVLLLILAKGNYFDKENAVQVNVIFFINSSKYDMRLIKEFVGNDVIEWLEIKQQFIKDKSNNCNTNNFTTESEVWKFY